MSRYPPPPHRHAEGVVRGLLWIRGTLSQRGSEIKFTVRPPIKLVFVNESERGGRGVATHPLETFQLALRPPVLLMMDSLCACPR